MFGSDTQKFTTLWTSMPSVEAAFSNIKCTHVSKHPEVAHGLRNDGTYKSAEAAAYPDGMNRAPAKSIMGSQDRRLLHRSSLRSSAAPCSRSAVYGTVQAGRLFSQKFRGALLEIGFEPSLDDEGVFRLDHRLGRIILATHVDDGIGGASTPEVLAWMYEQLEVKGFDFSQKGPWDTVLGFGCTRNHANRSVTLTARKQITDLAREHLCDEVAKSLNPPTPTDQSIMSLQPPPSETDAERAANEGWRSRARSLKGALIHIAHAHPAIQNGISRACKYMTTPTHESYAAAKRILAWLNNRLDLGVTFGAPHLRALDDLAPSAEPIMPMASERDYSLVCCVDSDLPGTPMQPRDTESDEPIDRASHRAQLGYNISFAGGSLEASSRRQASTAVDTPAAELFAASTAAAILVLIVSVVKFASFGRLDTTPVRIWCDNEAAVLVSKDATSIKRLAYIARRCTRAPARSGFVTQITYHIYSNNICRGAGPICMLRACRECCPGCHHSEAVPAPRNWLVSRRHFGHPTAFDGSMSAGAAGCTGCRCSDPR